MPRTEIFAPDGTTTVAIDLDPAEVYRTPVETLVSRHIGRIVRACREISARPIAGQSPQVLSERELRTVIPDAVLARPGRVWLAVPVVRDNGEDVTTVYDLDPE